MIDRPDSTAPARQLEANEMAYTRQNYVMSK